MKKDKFSFSYTYVKGAFSAEFEFSPKLPSLGVGVAVTKNTFSIQLAIWGVITLEWLR